MSPFWERQKATGLFLVSGLAGFALGAVKHVLRNWHLYLLLAAVAAAVIGAIAVAAIPGALPAVAAGFGLGALTFATTVQALAIGAAICTAAVLSVGLVAVGLGKAMSWVLGIDSERTHPEYEPPELFDPKPVRRGPLPVVKGSPKKQRRGPVPAFFEPAADGRDPSTPASAPGSVVKLKRD